MNRVVSLGAALASLLVLGNCATSPDPAAAPSYYVSAMSSVSAEAPAVGSYEIAPMDRAVAGTDAEFLAYAAYVERALTRKGLTPAAPGEQPDMLVLLRYGTGEPETHVRAAGRAEFDHLGMAAQGAAFSNAAASSGKSSSTFGGSGRSLAVPLSVNPATAREAVTTYTHFILLDGYRAAAPQAADDWEKVFETDIGSTGTSDDLRQAFPYMIAAALDTIATDTGDVIRTEISAADARLSLVRGASADTP
ncbi:MAG: hypothetical protein KDA53_11350 [Hyphomonas sp.]|nr:hypothetical protein [Hyphomonas sp.]